MDGTKELQNRFRDLARRLHEQAYDLEHAAEALAIIDHPDVYCRDAIRSAAQALKRWLDTTYRE